MLTGIGVGAALGDAEVIGAVAKGDGKGTGLGVGVGMGVGFAEGRGKVISMSRLVVERALTLLAGLVDAGCEEGDLSTF
jgi:hypothetical protein